MRWARLVGAAVLLGLLISTAAGCQPQFQPGTVTDDLGRAVTITGIPQRIISLSPSNTEILFALGLGDRVVGVTEYCNYPEEAKTRPKVGGFSTVDIERVVALEPDLILAGNIHQGEAIPAMERLGLVVVALVPDTLDGVLADITLVGEITGRKAEAGRLVESLQARIKAVTDKTGGLTEGQRPRVFYLIWHNPLMTAGSETYFDDLIRKAGGINIAGDLSGYADIGLEAVVEADPEVMITGMGHGSSEDLPYQFLQGETRLKDTDARHHNRVYELDADLVSRPSPRLVDALERFARFIHPELFP